MKRLSAIFCALLAAVSPLAAQGLDVDHQIEYCHGQVKKALAELQQADGGYDFTMQPRNILPTDKHKGWNCRKATAEEWCSGFWPPGCSSNSSTRIAGPSAEWPGPR